MFWGFIFAIVLQCNPFSSLSQTPFEITNIILNKVYNYRMFGIVPLMQLITNSNNYAGKKGNKIIE